MYFYSLVNRSDPGQETEKTKNTLFSLLKQGNDLGNVCPWCVCFMSAHSYHCPYCKKCVSCQEFHNSLLNNCIGKNNFKIYIAYLLYFCLVFTLKLFTGIYIFKNNQSIKINENKDLIIQDIMINFSFCAIGIYRVFKKMKLYNKVEKENQNGRYTKEKDNYFPEIDNKLSGLEL